MRLSYSSKISLTVAFLIALSITSYAFINVTFESNRRTKEMIEEKKNLNELIAFSVESAEYQSLTWYKKYIVRKAAEPEDVVYCRLVKPDGEIFLSNIEEERGKYILDPAIHTNQTLIKSDVFNGERIIVIVSPTYGGSTLWLGFSLKKIEMAVVQMYLEAAMMVAVAIAICVPISYFIVSNSLKPIKKLADLSKEVGKGNFEVRTDIQRTDEIGLLASSFNDMIDNLEKLKEKIRHSERFATIGQLAATIGHDLRNPLTAITNAVYYLKTKMNPNKDEKINKMFEIIDREIKYANKIIKDLLDFSRAKKPEFRRVDLTSLVENSLSSLEIPSNIKVITDLREIPRVDADQHELKRVFLNIIQNAVQAMPKGGTLTISAKKLNSHVELKFSDTGVGIPKENMKKLFTPLFTTKAKGMGLGLCVCKNIVEAHNGRIEVESEVGKGTTFTITLPVHQKRKGGEKEDGKGVRSSSGRRQIHQRNIKRNT